MRSEIKENGYIPSDLYNQIVKLMPIVSVEAVIVMDKALMFLKRKNQPAKEEWWFAGGRIRKGESLEETLHREKSKEETDMQIIAHKFIGVYSRVFPERHDITIAYLCRCKGPVTLDNEHSEYKLFRIMPNDLHPYLLETIRDSKWEKEL